MTLNFVHLGVLKTNLMLVIKEYNVIENQYKQLGNLIDLEVVLLS